LEEPVVSFSFPINQESNDPGTARNDFESQQ
jgi:hypothetical protein